jgi:hypothetical protein
MPTFEGNLLKMKTELADKVQYKLPVGEELVPMNELVGQSVRLDYQNQINCLACNVVTQKSFGQGYCYKCFISVPETSECILRPELCEAHLGKSRDMAWSENHCLTDHYVYLAVSSGLKVGVTRATQIPTRWIDQGAWKAIKLAMTPNRNLAGQIEVELKNYLSDKTSWQKMLKNELDESVDLEEAKQNAWEYLDPELQEYIIDDDEITEINYPVLSYPKKVKSLSFDKVETIEGKLTGIKGQYLIFDDQNVVNIRRHTGYKIKVTF